MRALSTLFRKVHPLQVLAPCSDRININSQIMDMYLEHLLPEIAQPGDDRNYGSAAMIDVMILQVVKRPFFCGLQIIVVVYCPAGGRPQSRP